MSAEIKHILKFLFIILVNFQRLQELAGVLFQSILIPTLWLSNKVTVFTISHVKKWVESKSGVESVA